MLHILLKWSSYVLWTTDMITHVLEPKKMKMKHFYKKMRSIIIRNFHRLIVLSWTSSNKWNTRINNKIIQTYLINCNYMYIGENGEFLLLCVVGWSFSILDYNLHHFLHLEKATRGLHNPYIIGTSVGPTDLH